MKLRSGWSSGSTWPYILLLQLIHNVFAAETMTLDETAINRPHGISAPVLPLLLVAAAN